MSRKISKIELEKLANKILRGTASEEEYKQLNDWYRDFDDAEVTLETNESREELRKRLWRGIRAQTFPPRNSYAPIWRWAAVVTLILAPVLFLLLSQETFIYGDEDSYSIVSHVTVPGQKRTIRLPDGSVVKLNSGSIIKYPERFSSRKRSVEIVGEAFFDVTRDESRPFVITARDIRVQVLGTSFNVKAFAGDPEINVAVKSGKVVVQNTRSTASVTLLQDEMVTCAVSGSGLQKKSITDKAIVFGWAEGKLVFDNESFDEVFKKISRWYGVKVILNGPLTHKKITASCRKLTLGQALEGLSHTYDFDYEIKGKIVTIKTH